MVRLASTRTWPGGPGGYDIATADDLAARLLAGSPRPSFFRLPSPETGMTRFPASNGSGFPAVENCGNSFAAGTDREFRPNVLAAWRSVANATGGSRRSKVRAGLSAEPTTRGCPPWAGMSGAHCRDGRIVGVIRANHRSDGPWGGSPANPSRCLAAEGHPSRAPGKQMEAPAFACLEWAVRPPPSMESPRPGKAPPVEEQISHHPCFHNYELQDQKQIGPTFRI